VFGLHKIYRYEGMRVLTQQEGLMSGSSYFDSTVLNSHSLIAPSSCPFDILRALSFVILPVTALLLRLLLLLCLGQADGISSAPRCVLHKVTPG
jgi:hypothetical protein